MRKPASRSLVPTAIIAGAALALAVAFAAAGAKAADVGSGGTFKGASSHKTSGKVEVVTENGQTAVRLKSNFNLDGAPDPKVGFGKGGKYDGKSKLGALKSNSGEQSYPVPAGLDISGYDEVYIWCEKYSVPLGVAKLK